MSERDAGSRPLRMLPRTGETWRNINDGYEVVINKDVQPGETSISCRPKARRGGHLFNLDEFVRDFELMP